MAPNTEDDLVAQLKALILLDADAARACLTLGRHHATAIKAMASDVPIDAEPTDDYVTDLDARHALFTTFRDSFPYTTSTTLALFMVLPLSELRLLTANAHLKQDSLKLLALTQANIGLKVFLAKKSTASGRNPSLTTPTDSPSRKRKRRTDSDSDSDSDSDFSPPAQIKAKARDNNVCILSGTDSPKGAHIFPFSASSSARLFILDSLVSLWGTTIHARWSQLYNDRAVTESPKNILCLNRQLHFWWSQCRFALKPLATAEPNTVKVQLHWLRSSCTLPTRRVDSARTCVEDLWGGGSNHTSWSRAPTAYRRSGLPLETGHVFTIRAENAADLPSFDLLELQWCLVRVAAMAGAAAADDLDGNDSDDEGSDYAVFDPDDEADDVF